MSSLQAADHAVVGRRSHTSGIGAGRKNLIDPRGRAGFIDQPALFAAIIFTAL